MLQEKLFKSKVIDMVKEIMDNPKQEDIYMIYFYCLKHQLFFWRNIKDNYGMCSKCKENNINLIYDYHLPQHTITNEVWDVIDKKLMEKKLISFGFHAGSKESDKENVNMTFEEEKGIAAIEWKKEGQEIIGKLIEVKDHLGELDSTMYIVEQENKEIIGIWETGFLATLMANVQIGEKIKIVFEGLGKPKKKGYSPPKLFRVFVDR